MKDFEKIPTTLTDLLMTFQDREFSLFDIVEVNFCVKVVVDIGEVVTIIVMKVGQFLTKFIIKI